VNPLTDIIPSRYRRYLYAAGALAALVYGAYEASGRNWGATGASLIGSLVVALAHANTSNAAPADEATAPPKPPAQTPMAVGIVAVLALLGGGVVSPPAGSSRWLPTADRPLGLQWVLDGPLNLQDPVAMGLRDMAGHTLPAPDVYDIDGEYNTAATVAALHARGAKVICYFDAGVYETYRADAGSFPAGIWGNPDGNWDGSYWLDIRRVNDLAPIMQARIADCRAKGFDAVEPDEVDGWSNDSGFPLTYADQLAYNRAVAGWVHAAGMSVLLKGDLEQAHDLVGDFDFSLNEECFQ
jgi:hypothetical protein